MPFLGRCSISYVYASIIRPLGVGDAVEEHVFVSIELRRKLYMLQVKDKELVHKGNDRTF